MTPADLHAIRERAKLLPKDDERLSGSRAKAAFEATCWLGAMAPLLLAHVAELETELTKARLALLSADGQCVEEHLWSGQEACGFAFDAGRREEELRAAVDCWRWSADDLLKEVEKAREFLGNGTDDSRWMPGETAVDALIRLLAEAEQKIAAVEQRCALAEGTCAKAEEALLRLEKLPEESQVRVMVRASHATGESLMQAEAEIENLKRDKAELEAENARLRKEASQMWTYRHVNNRGCHKCIIEGNSPFECPANPYRTYP